MCSSIQINYTENCSYYLHVAYMGKGLIINKDRALVILSSVHSVPYLSLCATDALQSQNCN